MQVIAAIVGRQKLIGMLRVADHAVEINHSIEISRSANPAVDGLPVSFAQWTRMIIARPNVRSDGRSDHVESVCMRACNYLLICR